LTEHYQTVNDRVSECYCHHQRPL